MDKIKSREALAKLSQDWRLQGKKIVYTSGAFDILHAGHVGYLAKARVLGDILVVGLNSDKSIKEYKSADRPIVPQSARAAVLAGLQDVDHIFIFDEKNNNINIELLKPHVYVKAGDYSKDKLSSASIVEGYGGRVELIPFVDGFSTTSVIDRVLAVYAKDLPRVADSVTLTPAPAVFVDRDGVINEETEYLSEPSKFKLIPDALKGLKLLQEGGFRIVIITNQAGIGLGYFSKEDFYKVNKELLKAASLAGIKIDRVFFCPHSKADNCACRKPAPGMILRGIEELNLVPERSFCIGDKTGDVLAGQQAGIRTVLVKTGHAGADKEFDVKPDFIAENLHEAAKLILSCQKR